MCWCVCLISKIYSSKLVVNCSWIDLKIEILLLFTLMNSSIWFGTMNLGWSIAWVVNLGNTTKLC